MNKPYRITYDCLIDPHKLPFILAALDRLVLGAGGEPGQEPQAVPLDHRPVSKPGELPKLKRMGA